MSSTRRTFLKQTLRVGALGVLAAAGGASLSGCGSSMAQSAFPDTLTLLNVTTYGNPDVQIERTPGDNPNGTIEVPSSSTVLRVGEPILVRVEYFAEIPGVNPDVFEDDDLIGLYSATWSQVLAGPNAAQTVTFQSPAGDTFTSSTLVGRNARLDGVSANLIQVIQPGPVTLRLDIALQMSDRSRQSKTIDVTINVTG